MNEKNNTDKEIMTEILEEYCASLAAAVAINDKKAIQEAKDRIAGWAMIETGYDFNTDTARYEKIGPDAG